MKNQFLSVSIFVTTVSIAVFAAAQGGSVFGTVEADSFSARNLEIVLTGPAAEKIISHLQSNGSRPFRDQQTNAEITLAKGIMCSDGRAQSKELSCKIILSGNEVQ